MRKWNQLDGLREEEVRFCLSLENLPYIHLDYLENPYFGDKSNWKVQYDEKFQPIGL
jgi:hypothetical protein